MKVRFRLLSVTSMNMAAFLYLSKYKLVFSVLPMSTMNSYNRERDTACSISRDTYRLLFLKPHVYKSPDFPGYIKMLHSSVTYRICLQLSW